jgi:heme-degrading monooxygenase HmoA
MVHVLVHHKVADFLKWKQVFDSHLNKRMGAGETGCRLFHSIEDPREVTLLLDWESLEHARRFMTSSDLRTTMQSAGVVGEPEVHYLQDALTVRRTSAD